MVIFTLFPCSAWNTCHEGDLVCHIFLVHAPACVCSSLITSALLSQVFPQRQQSSLHAALQLMEREEFAGSPEKGKLGCADATWVYCVLCIRSKLSTCLHCPAGAVGGPGWHWFIMTPLASQSLSLPSCHTQQFSEYRNSHAGILADWFSVLTVD